MRKYSLLQGVIQEWNKLSNDCVNASSLNIFDTGGLYVDGRIVGLSISQWLPCPFVAQN